VNDPIRVGDTVKVADGDYCTRDLSISNSTSTTRRTNHNYGGLVVAVMAVVVVIVVVWIGHAVYVNVIAPAVQKATQPVTRSTTCREYLALPDGERAA